MRRESGRHVVVRTNMMDIITKDELNSLLGERGTVCVSLFMPAHRAGREIRQDPIRLKNLLRDAEERLVASSLPLSGVSEILSPAQRLLHDSHFWRYQCDGLAVFHIKPLMPLPTGNGRFYLLASNQKDVKLLECTEHTITGKRPNVV